MSRLPKHPTNSGIPSSGLPSPGGKRRSSAGTTGKSTLNLKELTPEQESLLQAAMERYNPSATTKLNENNQSSPSSTLGNIQSLPSTLATNNQSNSPLKKPGGRRQSVSRMTRPTLPPLSEKSPVKQPLTMQHTSPTSKLSSNYGLPPPNLSSPLQRSLSGQNQNVSGSQTLPSALNPVHQRLQVTEATQRPTSPSLALYSIGERVTVESMNISGTLKFLGQIDTKLGTWAGIEVDAPGTGKNDGCVNGKSYFTCPPKSGIFVNSTKLTKSKESRDVPNLPQTSSVNKSSNAMLRSPSTSSNSSDKASPGTHAQNAAIAAGRITAGSRASKYIGVTASQLKNRGLAKPSIITGISDNALNGHTTSPKSKPTLGLGIMRPSSLQSLKSPSTPPSNGRQYRNRRDSSSSTGSAVSNISQPASYVPKTSSGLPRSRSVTPNPPNESQHTSDSENNIKEEMSNKSLQEKIQKLLNDPDTPDSVPLGLFDQQAIRIQQLQMKIEVLETENTHLKLHNKKSQSPQENDDIEKVQWKKEKKAFFDERELREKALNDQISDLSRQLQEVVVKGHHHRPSTSLSMIADDDNMSDKILQLTELIEQKDEHLKSLEETIKELEKTNSNQSSINAQNETLDNITQLEKVVQDKTIEIDQLNAKFDQFKLNSESTIKTLQESINNLKLAGQETINIYEMKVSSLEQQVEDLKKGGVETITLYEEATIRIAEREEKINTLEKEAEELRSAGVEAIDVYEKTIEETKREVEEVSSQLLKKEETITSLSKEADRLKLVLKELAEAKIKLEMNDKREEGLRNELADLQTGLEHMMRADAKSRERTYQLEDEVRESQALVNRQLEEISSLKNNMQDLMNANNNEEIEKIKEVFESEAKRLQEELEDVRKTLSEVQTEKRIIASETDSLKDEKKILEKKMQDSDRKKNDIIVELEALKISKKQDEDEKNQIVSQLEELRLNVTKDEEKKKQLIQESNIEKKTLVEECENTKKELVETREIAQKELENLQKQLYDLTKKAEYAEQLKSELEIKSQEIKNLSENFEDSKNESEKLKSSQEAVAQNNLENLKIEYENQINVYKVENDQLKQKINDLALTKKNITDTIQQNTQGYEEKIAAYEEQVARFTHIVHELTRENVSISGENKKILAEQEKLMEAHKQVENECLKLMDELERLHSESLNGQYTINITPLQTGSSHNADGTKLGENQETSGDKQSQTQQNINGQHANGDLMRLQSLLAEKQTQLERLSSMHNSEIRELRKKVSELEKSKKREIKSLNKDVAELESLIESKIFREADLEEEIQRERGNSKRLKDEVEDLREQLTEIRNLDNSTNVLEATIIGNGIISKSSINSNKPNGVEDGTTNLYCEICDEEGHDIISCKAVFGSHSSNITEDKSADDYIQNENAIKDRPYCEYCEEFGLHWTEECPNQNETF
ncbi:16962_t:CDS:2 [Funneliformis geosporum]|uniref:8896_t:CDS:1 n=1 Tax=Funneliformis geosporum TaxID=1117311 RepID=A0A9W4SQP7_9GLOM|nr:16962_t:CDS:2 [Funneliformis geosporum]CAI2178098.1 8896_t:CDS:2 [Funneliformis geosporum]